MMRINLLPPEILERRKAEQRFGYIIAGAVVVALILAGVWVFAFSRIQSKQTELAKLEQQVQETNNQANRLAIFEQRATELETRRATATQALANRRDWARLMDEISLVLPSDVWLQSLTAGEKEGLVMNGYAIDVEGDSPDAGHKSVAKALVRLADLNDIYDVWLTSSQKMQVAEHDAIQFSITTKVGTPPMGGGAK